MRTVQEIFDYLDGIAPVSSQMSFDNSGFLIGHGDAGIEKVLLALDITDAVIEEAVKEHAQLIVSHHPVIFSPLRSITDKGEGRRALYLIEHRIAAICMHTNLDIAQGGVNDVLMACLGARVESPLDEENCGRIGWLENTIPFDEFLQKCKTVLHAKGLRYCCAGRPVHRLAVMGGAGADAIEAAAAAGCDTYVTSDVKYHQFQKAFELGINLIDADHFCTENPMIPVLAEHLKTAFPDLNVCVSKQHGQLVSFL